MFCTLGHVIIWSMNSAGRIFVLYDILYIMLSYDFSPVGLLVWGASISFS